MKNRPDNPGFFVMVKVSVLLPVKNQEEFIERAVESVYSQTFDDFELIAVDDGSSDSTGYILNRLKSKYGFTLITHKKNLGIVKALNNALGKAKGKYIARMDGDDLMLPKRLESQWLFLENNPDISLCGTLVEIFKEYKPVDVHCGCRIKAPDMDLNKALKLIEEKNRVSEGAKIYEKWNNSLITHEQMFDNLYVDCPIVHPTFFGRRELFEGLGGYKDTGYAEDYDFVFRAIFSGYKLGKVPKVLLRWRDHENRETRTNKNLKKDRLFFQKAYFFSKFDKRSEKGVYVVGVGKFGKKLIGALKTYNVKIKGVLDFSGKRKGCKVRGIEVVPPDSVDKESWFILAYSLNQTPNEEMKHFYEKYKERIIPWVL